MERFVSGINARRSRTLRQFTFSHTRRVREKRIKREIKFAIVIEREVKLRRKMSLLINILDDFVCPSRLSTRRYGMEVDDLLTLPHIISSPYLCPRSRLPTAKDCHSTRRLDKDKFQLDLDVKQFKPDEINVRVTGNTITIEGKHEEKRDEHGYVSRHFIRRCVLPEGHDINGVVSKLSSDGVLSITAPRIEKNMDEKERQIPVIQTEAPAAGIEVTKE